MTTRLIVIAPVMTIMIRAPKKIINAPYSSHTVIMRRQLFLCAIFVSFLLDSYKHPVYGIYLSHTEGLIMDFLASISTAKGFGAEIRRQRKAAKLTQAELATAMGTTRRLVSALENGERGVSIEMALGAASELGLELRMEPRS
ncbi:MAG: hypothetical protein CMI59_13120 [Parvibaculum sp.]|nr:hypothetical protein [Parvibaculum sp.]